MWDITDYYTSQVIFLVIVLLLEENDIDNKISNNLDYTRAEFNTHANMMVLGKNYYITNYTGRTAEVEPFLLEIESLYQVPIVDTVMQYDNLYTDEIYLLVFKNTFSILAMTYDLMSPFLLREAGLIVDDVLKL